MKNIHILPTERTSRLYYNSQEKAYQLCEFPKYHTDIKSTHNLYITNDEEIKEGDWVIDDEQDVFQVLEVNNLQGILRSDGFTYVIDVCKKIILTTDQDLDGVQAIDDEFLEWFVKNSSCKEVGIVNDTLTVGEMSKLPLGTRNHKYKIIIPKEEPKQDSVFDKLEVEKEYEQEIFELGEEPRQEITINEVSKKLKGKELFKESNDRARKTLSEIKSLPIQETLEEDALRLLPDRNGFTNRDRFNFIEGATYKQIEINALKIKQERSYSEEDLEYAFEQGKLNSNICYRRTFRNVLEILQFKKK
jgi:hypothetical protein